MEFKIFIWVSDFMTKNRIAHELRKDINRRFTEEHIELAAPRRSVLIRETKK